MEQTVPMQKVNLNGRWELLLPEHRAARGEWWVDWEKERLDSMSKNIGPGDVVYDIGSEEGDISGLVQSWIGKGDGGVCLFEPNPAVWANIKAIWDANELKSPLGYCCGFAGSTNRSLDKLNVTDWPESAHGPIISDHGFANLWERPDLPAIRLDDFVNLTNAMPTVLTIDCEGSELHVLQGSHDILDELKPLVFVSVHEQFLVDMYQQTAQDLFDFMANLGYRSKHLATDHEAHFAFWHPFGRELRF